MGFLIFFMFLALSASLAFSVVRRPPYAGRLRAARWLAVILCSSVFAYWFVQRSASKFIPDSLAVQIINKLPQPLDFYIIKKLPSNYETVHIGKIRPDYYRIEYLQMPHSDEFWIAGYLGKKNLSYFSQHYVPNKNMDQIIEVQNYIIQSQKLADSAQKQISSHNSSNISRSTWVVLCLLLLFMNLVLLMRGH